MPTDKKVLTVGELKKALRFVPDDTPVVSYDTGFIGYLEAATASAGPIIVTKFRRDEKSKSLTRQESMYAVRIC